MKVTFYRNIKTRSGKCGNGKEVFMSMKNDTICISRIFTYPRLTDHNHFVGSKMTAAANLWKSVHDDFKADLVVYANAFNSQRLKDKKLPISAFNVFIKAVCKHAEPFDTLEGFAGLIGIMGETISEWIIRGFLPPVSRIVFSDANVVSGL